MEEKEVLKELGVEPSRGLGRQEAEGRLLKYGPNELRVEEGPSTMQILLGQFRDMLIIILLVAIVLSALVGEVFDAGLILLIVLFSAGLGFTQEYKAEKALEALRKMISPTITVLRDGEEAEVPTREVVPGDVLLLEAGDRVPADARIYTAHSLKADEASLTGESAPVEKTAGVLSADTRVSDRRNMVFTGTVIAYGRGRAVVVLTGMQTEFGKIAREVGKIRKEKTPLEQRTEEIGRWLGAISLTVCFLAAGVGVVREALTAGLTLGFAITMVMFAVSLAVAAVPEALAGIVTGTLAIGMREMAKENALIRRMPAVETLGSVTVICSDKTGTITKGEMTARRIYVDGSFVEVSGVGYEPRGDFSPAGATRGIDLLLRAGVLCNDALLRNDGGRWLIMGDPTEGALVVLAAKAGFNVKDERLKNPRIDEIPFSSERKRMSTVHPAGDGRRVAFMKGAPEVVLRLCTSEIRDDDRQGLDEARRAAILGVAEEMARAGLRVLALATREMGGGAGEIEANMSFIGLVGMMDPPREEAVEAVKVCGEVGIRPVMITGDHKLTAMAVAREVGIYHDGDIALTGAELEALSEGEFEAVVERASVYARVSPLDKLKIVRAWKKKGQIVAMTGDGVNDAPALRHADIGVAMGITGTEVSKEASDMVLADDNFATILRAIEMGRWIYDNIKKYLTYLLRANIIEVVVLGGVVVLKGPEYLPLLPAAILYINFVTDGLPAIALGVAPPEPDIMQRPPRDPRESVFSFDVKVFIFLSLLTVAPFFFWAFFRRGEDIALARTDLFFLFVIVELVMAVNLRSLRYSVFRLRPHKLLLASVLLGVILTFALVQVPQVRGSLGVVIPGTEDMEIVLAIALWVTLSTELTKVFLKKRAERTRHSP